MIKKILVALDPDSDTAVAVRYAIDLARRFDAEITAMAVVDMGSIDSTTRGGGIGSMYYADILREQLTIEAREKAQELIERFGDLVADAGVRSHEVVREGVPFDRIVEDMKYHDLLIVGKNPHFFYSHEKRPTETLARLVATTVGPSLIVPDDLRDIRRVLLAFDGSHAAAQAMQSFVQLCPFGRDVAVRVLCVHKETSADSDLALRFAESYLKAHGFDIQVVSMQSDSVEKAIMDNVEHFRADLVVAGAHSKSFLQKLAFGSTTAHLVRDCPVALFLDS